VANGSLTPIEVLETNCVEPLPMLLHPRPRARPEGCRLRLPQHDGCARGTAGNGSGLV